jgi:hypothetical protein
MAITVAHLSENMGLLPETAISGTAYVIRKKAVSMYTTNACKGSRGTIIHTSVLHEVSVHPLYPCGKNSWYPLNRGLGGTQCQSGYCVLCIPSSKSAIAVTVLYFLSQNFLGAEKETVITFPISLPYF